jgi:acyl-CoA synthetase (AMP-forming)/AMP-acid ligase II
MYNVIVHHLQEQARVNPDKPYIYYGDQEITFGDLEASSNQMAHFLLEKGISKGDRVIIHISNRPEFLIAFFGILKAGGVAVPTMISYAADELRYAVTNSEAKGIVTEDSYRPLVAEIRPDCESIQWVVTCDQQGEEAWITLPSIQAQYPPKGPAIKLAGKDLAVFFYTSGTTARPKAVMFCHENLVYAAEVTAKHFYLTPSDRSFCFHSLFHQSGLFIGTLPPLMLGGSVVLLPAFPSTEFWRQVARYQPTYTALTGSMLRLLLLQPPCPEEQGHTLRVAGIAPITSMEDVFTFEERFHIRLLPAYLLMETFSLATMSPLFGERYLKTDMPGFPIGIPTLVVSPINS